jgi:hypothetical protein
MEMLYGVLLGAGTGLLVALAGYLKQLKTTNEKPDLQKAGITAVIGIAAGALLSTGVVGGDVLLTMCAAAGITGVGEDAVKTVIRWIVPESGKSKSN